MKIAESSSSDSEDDVPLSARLAVPKPAPKPILKKKPEKQPKPEAAAVAIKEEPKKEGSVANGKGKPPSAKASKPPPSAKASKPKTEGKVKASANGKKVYELPGQTRETPEETDPVRKFYESLSKQKPESVMARKWLMQHGMLPHDQAQALFDKIKRERQKAKGVKPTQQARKKAKVEH